MKDLSPSTITIADPPDLGRSVLDIFNNVIQSTSYASLIGTVDQLLQLSQDSFNSRQHLKEIHTLLNTISSERFPDIIHLLHITMFLHRLESGPNIPFEAFHYTLPITKAVKTLLTQTDLSTALTHLPCTLVDVLTAHPVDMDRGLVTNLKGKLEYLSNEWSIKTMAFSTLTDDHAKLATRAELSSINLSIRDTICMLLHTPNYRSKKIKPESEQRNLSRAIKANEDTIITHWPKLIMYVQFCFFEAILQQKKHPLTNEETALLNLPRTPENYKKWISQPDINTHPLFQSIVDLKKTMKYVLQIWRGDMDGNPFVTGTTMALSIAYGRKRSFERLSADDAVIRYAPKNEFFKQIESDMETRLDEIAIEGEPDWIHYIQDRRQEGWSPVQIYSGLTYFRMVELTEASELFSRHPNDLSLLKKGFSTELEFLEWASLLGQAEEAAGLQQGTWSKLLRLIRLRGLSLGHPHARKGERFHLDIIENLLSILSKTTGIPGNTQKEKLHHFLTLSHDTIQDALPQLDSANKEILDHYAALITIQPNATLIQSDSGSITKDIEWSILALKAISHCLGHTGKIVILCEDETSMASAISVMEQKNTALFDRLIMMCAGSDNQKKSGPFYSGYINHTFLTTAAKHNVSAFFGVGDSPLRSSPHDPLCTYKTFQPGSRKLFFWGDRVLSYLSHRLATRISTLAFSLHLSAEDKARHTLIAKTLGESMLNAYKTAIITQTPLHSAIQSISEIVTTYFSRPSKKYGTEGFILDQIRAIDSSRAQLILNTFDPQLSGFNKGLDTFLKEMARHHISEKQYQDFFNHTPLGHAFLDTILYFINHLDDDLETPSDIRTITSQELAHSYTTLSGKKPTLQQDPHLRLARLLWNHASNRDDKDELLPVTMLIFGANWMI